MFSKLQLLWFLLAIHAVYISCYFGRQKKCIGVRVTNTAAFVVRTVSLQFPHTGSKATKLYAGVRSHVQNIADLSLADGKLPYTEADPFDEMFITPLPLFSSSGDRCRRVHLQLQH